MTPRIILPAHTTVTVGDTLWWGVEGEIVPPEWQALTKACATCGGWGYHPHHRMEWHEVDCALCHEGRRTVEVERMPWPGEWDDVAPGTETPVPLGRAVIDGDWAPIVDWKDQRAIATLDRFVATGWEGDPSWFGLYTRGALPGQRMERFTLHVHGHTGPGGYAARFEVIA